MAYPYTRSYADWKDFPDTTTPIDQASLDNMDAGIKSVSDVLIPNTIVDAKGDLIVATAADTLARKAAGANDEVLIYDSVQSTGVKTGKVANAQVDAAAAITRSKLASTTLAIFTPLHNEPPAANYATLDLRNSHPTLDFDAITDESAVFRGVLSRDYGGRGLTVKLIWAATSATLGTTRWAVAFERIPAGTLDIDADSFATAKTAGGVADATNGKTTETEIAFTNGAEISSLAAGEMFRLKVTRDADGTSGTDDMIGDAELLTVEIRET